MTIVMKEVYRPPSFRDWLWEVSLGIGKDLSLNKNVLEA
jgi:hypothetical protein